MFMHHLYHSERSWSISKPSPSVPVEYVYSRVSCPLHLILLFWRRVCLRALVWILFSGGFPTLEVFRNWLRSHFICLEYLSSVRGGVHWSDWRGHEVLILNSTITVVIIVIITSSWLSLLSPSSPTRLTSVALLHSHYGNSSFRSFGDLLTWFPPWVSYYITFLGINSVIILVTRSEYHHWYLYTLR